ncbi:MAG TPA: LysR family transcriptional regulator [Stellaceae bacterium]|jgi:DNA-binding transcriptional LysR family regulator|nr:LysR family transcriptional regulator [Stellaceae bacterium]
MFDWDDLRYFLAVARHGSTLSAAKALSLSQSTVHRRLDELEKRLGQRLVLRSPAGYKLTELGEEMVAYAARIEEAAFAFERRLGETQIGLSGSIRITCPEAVGSRLMRSHLLADFQQLFPKLHVEFVMSDKLLDLGKGQADIAIRGAEPHDESLLSRRIADTPWAIYASKAYCVRKGEPRAIGDIGEHEIALFDVELAQHVINQWFKQIAPNARIAARCNSISGLLAAAKSGVGLAALPVAVGGSETDLVQVLGPVTELTTHFYLVTHRDLRDAPRVKAFSGFIEDNRVALRAVLAGKSPAN